MLEKVKLRHQLPHFDTCASGLSCEGAVNANEIMPQTGELNFGNWTKELGFRVEKSIELLQKLAQGEDLSVGLSGRAKLLG